MLKLIFIDTQNCIC